MSLAVLLLACLPAFALTTTDTLTPAQALDALQTAPSGTSFTVSARPHLPGVSADPVLSREKGRSVLGLAFYEPGEPVSAYAYCPAHHVYESLPPLLGFTMSDADRAIVNNRILGAHLALANHVVPTALSSAARFATFPNAAIFLAGLLIAASIPVVRGLTRLAQVHRRPALSGSTKTTQPDLRADAEDKISAAQKRLAELSARYRSTL